MTTVNQVPFSQLQAIDAINARATTKDGIDELAASIAAVGLIQALAVRPSDGGGYEVIDGRRRYQAMQKLVKAKTWRKDQLVPVLIRNEDDAAALELSLLANTIRLPMHPVDQHEVFARLADQGRSDAEIATRFGIAEKTVRQRRALGRLAPEILKAWKADKLDEKTAQAFTIAGQHDVQVATYDRLRKQMHNRITDWAVKRELANDRPAARFASAEVLETYFARGGTVTESLFDEDRLIDDAALLRTVQREALDAEVAKLKGQGWAWVASADELPREWRWSWDRADDEPVYTPEETTRLEELETALEGAGSDEEFERIEAEQAAIERAAEARAITPEKKARSGCVVEITNTGEIAVSVGYIRPEHSLADDLPDAEEDDTPADPFDEDRDDVGAQDDEQDDADGPRISGALVQTLSEAKTFAAAEALKGAPAVAIAVIAAALIAKFDSPAHVTNHGHVVVRLPEGRTFAELLPVMLADKEAIGLKFAAAVASTLDLTEVRWKFKSRDSGIDVLMAALPEAPFTAAAREAFLINDYFKRASKAVAIAALEEMREAGATGLAPDDVLAGMKKADLAEAAAQTARETGWLPPELRHPAFVLARTPSAEAA